MTQTHKELQRRLEEIEGWVHRRTGGAIRDLRVEVRADGYVISGRATSYYTRQLAEQAALDVSGSSDIYDEIEII